MARLTLKRYVPSEKREPRRLVLLLHVSNRPGVRRVTAQAVRAKLGFVNVRVT